MAPGTPGLGGVAAPGTPGTAASKRDSDSQSAPMTPTTKRRRGNSLALRRRGTYEAEEYDAASAKSPFLHALMCIADTYSNTKGGSQAFYVSFQTALELAPTKAWEDRLILEVGSKFQSNKSGAHQSAADRLVEDWKKADAAAAAATGTGAGGAEAAASEAQSPSMAAAPAPSEVTRANISMLGCRSDASHPAAAAPPTPASTSQEQMQLQHDREIERYKQLLAESRRNEQAATRRAELLEDAFLNSQQSNLEIETLASTMLEKIRRRNAELQLTGQANK